MNLGEGVHIPMLFDFKRVGLTLTIALVALFATSVTMAAAAITPAGHNLKMSSSKVEFKFGSTAIICEKGEATGPITNPASQAVQLSNPVFQNAGGKPCTTSGMGGATFSVVTNSDATHYFGLLAQSSTAGALKLPGSNAAGEGLEFISGTCKLSAKADSPSGVWLNGQTKSPLANPSTLTFSNVLINLHGAEANEKTCPAALITELSKARQVGLTATFNVTDTTAPSQAVMFN